MEGIKKKKKCLQIVSVWKVRYSVVFAFVSWRENDNGQKRRDASVLIRDIL
jgi:hypothetical protein